MNIVFAGPALMFIDNDVFSIGSTTDNQSIHGYTLYTTGKY